MQPQHYTEFLEELRSLVLQSKTKALLQVNQELLFLYWNIGKKIIAQQQEKGWGAKVVQNLAQDLSASFPDMKGFSLRNLKNMQKFALAYPDFEFVQPVAAQLSWTHHVIILDKFKDQKTRLWYILKSVEQGWSKRVLMHQIDLQAHAQFGTLPNNFEHFLPKPQSELAAQLFKDEYIFEFIAQNDKFREKDFEKEITQNVTDFLLALGKGFSYVGRQYHLEVGGQDFYLDLLFYHFKLKCFVVVELKIDDFKPEYVGKLNFYLSAVDDLLKQDSDQPSIGLLLCKSKNDVVVEYALRDVSKPMGVASYQLTKKIPHTLKDQLPTEEDWVKILNQIKKK
ncbi:PDDEXK nuclease domain-containing protein [Hugenholtzia roseola]|uniref:PDDEXK nuclease domain-containing protein n=1 Tax=Hugenholtzia roseola TaxID=1002 RepID=UPI0003F58F88|nr:PDDEXK nuclease domain-containing protein [Hugenholtzia roseola]